MNVETETEETTQIYIGRDVWKRLKIAAAQHETSMRNLVERGVEVVLRELDGKAKK